MKTSFALLCAITLAAITADAQKPFPRGTIVVLPTNDPSIGGEACWSDQNIVGVLLRTHWSTVEANRGTFDWSYFHQGLRLARANNKFVVLSISAVDAPSWVTAVVPAWTNSISQSCPYPWDPNLQTYWNELVQSMGQTFDGDSLVHGVDMWAGGTGGGGASGIDCIFAPNRSDCTNLDAIAGGGPGSGNGLWNSACKALCGTYLNAFPTTQCLLHPGKNYINLDPQSMSNVATWWLNRFPGSNSLFFNGFNVNNPAYDPTLGYTPWPSTNLNISTINNGMFQTLDYIGSTRMQGQTLAQVFQNVHNIVAVQIYPTDPATDPGEQTIINFNHSVGL